MTNEPGEDKVGRRLNLDAMASKNLWRKEGPINGSRDKGRRKVFLLLRVHKLNCSCTSGTGGTANPRTIRLGIFSE